MPGQPGELNVREGGSLSSKFISFLGMGDYTECTYLLPAGNKGGPVTTRFIQEALVRTVCSGFTANDSVCIFLTDGARGKNWDAQSAAGSCSLSEIFDGLREQQLLKARLVPVPIPDGRSEQEIWKIFSCMYDCIDENDSVIFDITHAFRSIPMLGMVVLNYARYLKNITIDGIYYGAFEARNKDTNEAPILNLTSFYELMQWTSAADSFTSYGRSNKIEALVRSRSKTFRGTKEVGINLAVVTSNLDTVRGSEVVNGSMFQTCINKIDALKNIPENQYQPAFGYILNNIEKKLSLFKTDSMENMFHAINWYLEYGQIQQAATLLEEGIITLVMKESGVDIHDRSKRKLCGNMIQEKIRILRGEGICSDNHDNDIATRQKIETSVLLQNKKLIKAYDKLSQLRNDINHGGFKVESKKSGAAVEQQIRTCYKEIKQILSDLGYIEKTDFSETKKLPSIFCLLNHELTERQLNELLATYETDKVVYPPDAVKNEWSNIPTDNHINKGCLNDIISWLKSANADAGDVIIIQGEFGATFAVVDYALQKGIIPLHSVTKRIEKEHREGETVYREYVFEHVCFREYAYYDDISLDA
jgi:CRISPR-associated Csx2 family protein